MNKAKMNALKNLFEEVLKDKLLSGFSTKKLSISKKEDKKEDKKEENKEGLNLIENLKKAPSISSSIISFTKMSDLSSKMKQKKDDGKRKPKK